jgi:VIT1/CCC1 family predicted Fe2+/Mn2+ transporter
VTVLRLISIDTQRTLHCRPLTPSIVQAYTSDHILYYKYAKRAPILCTNTILAVMAGALVVMIVYVCIQQDQQVRDTTATIMIIVLFIRQPET